MRMLALVAVLVLAPGATGAQDRMPDIPGVPSGSFGALNNPDAQLAGTAPLGGPVDPKEYIVGPGDVFQLHLSGNLTRTVTLQVGAEGTLYAPGHGSVPVAGRTLEDTRREVLKRLAGEFRGVTMDLRLVRTRLMQIFLTGDIRTIGPLVVPASAHVSDVLPDSLFGQTSSRRNIVIRRHVSASKRDTLITADLDRFRQSGDRSLDALLSDGDVLVVPTVSRWVQIEGAVARPAKFELGPRDSLRTLLSLAGGALPSASDSALLVRFTTPTVTESTFFAVSEVISGLFNPPMRDGDQAYLYFVPRFHVIERASIYGEIDRPGSYPIHHGYTRLSGIVREAGGFLDRADLSTIRVFRGSQFAREADPELARLSQLSRREMTSSEYALLRARLAARNEDLRVDWKRLSGSPDLDLLMEDGDIVRVDPITASVRVDGEVKRPGVIAFVEGRSVDEYVQLAGGYSKRASKGQVRITSRTNGHTSRAKDTPTLAPGDLIWVPEKGDSNLLQNSQTAMLVLAQIATVILAINALK
jgi:protein involved in polysaccharide export with SLBB domain